MNASIATHRQIRKAGGDLGGEYKVMQSSEEKWMQYDAVRDRQIPWN